MERVFDCKINVDSFIDEIGQRPALWDRNDDNYHNKKTHSDHWSDIAQKHGVEVIAAKAKWKNLRDCYRVEVKRLKRDNSDRQRARWRYFERMSFLRDTLKSRNVFNETQTLYEEKIKDEVEISSPRIIDDESIDEISNHRTNHGHFLDEVHIIQAQNRKWDAGIDRNPLETVDDDQHDDMLFFRSLLPFLKRLDQDKKLLFRMNVQQMLYNQLYSNK